MKILYICIGFFFVTITIYSQDSWVGVEQYYPGSWKYIGENEKYYFYLGDYTFEQSLNYLDKFSGRCRVFISYKEPLYIKNYDIYLTGLSDKYEWDEGKLKPKSPPLDVGSYFYYKANDKDKIIKSESIYEYHKAKFVDFVGILPSISEMVYKLILDNNDTKGEDISQIYSYLLSNYDILSSDVKLNLIEKIIQPVERGSFLWMIKARIIQQKTQDYKESLEIYKLAINKISSLENNSNYGNILLEIANCYIMLNNYRLAEQNANNAIKYLTVNKLYSAFAFYIRAKARYLNGDLKNACLDYNKAIELGYNPNPDIDNIFCQ